MAVATNNKKSKLLLLEILKQGLDNYLPWVGLFKFFERNICTASLSEQLTKKPCQHPLIIQKLSISTPVYFELPFFKVIGRKYSFFLLIFILYI